MSCISKCWACTRSSKAVAISRLCSYPDFHRVIVPTPPVERSCTAWCLKTHFQTKPSLGSSESKLCVNSCSFLWTNSSQTRNHGSAGVIASGVINSASKIIWKLLSQKSCLYEMWKMWIIAKMVLKPSRTGFLLWRKYAEVKAEFPILCSQCIKKRHSTAWIQGSLFVSSLWKPLFFGSFGFSKKLNGSSLQPEIKTILTTTFPNRPTPQTSVICTEREKY